LQAPKLLLASWEEGVRFSMAANNIKNTLFLLIVAGGCRAQSIPVSIGWPSTFMRYNDKPGAPVLKGDTWRFSGYTRAGNRIGSFNDGSASGVSCNFGLVKLMPYAYGDLNTTSISLATSSTFCDNTVGYGSESHVDTDYGNGCSASGPCTNKSIGGFSIAGHFYVNVHHSGVQAGGLTIDATFLRSDDIDSANPHFCNPATLAANSGTCPSNSTTLAGDPPRWSTGTGVLFPNDQRTAGLFPILPANYQDDGSTCPSVEGQNTYVFFYGQSSDTLGMYLYRVPCATLPNLNIADWQAWTGSAWTSTLANAASIITLSSYVPSIGGAGCGAGYWGQEGAGVQPSVTYLPTFNRYVMVAQFYNDGCILPAFKAHLRFSQSASIYGPWSFGIASSISPDIYQYGTNPHGFRLASGGITSTATTLNLDSGPTQTGQGQYFQLRDPAVPFILQIDSELMQVTAATAGSASWTVTRGFNGTSAIAHAAGAAVILPYRLHPALISFVQGSYVGSDPNRVTMDLAFEGDEAEGNSYGDKSNDVYGLYFMRLTFQAEAPARGATLIGNVPLRFTMGAIGDKGIPRSGLVRFYDFFDHNGKTLYPVMRPRDLITGATCVPASAGGASLSSLFWVSQGLMFTNGSSFFPRCTTTDNWPLTGNSAFTITLVANPSSVGSLQVFGNLASYGTNGQGLAVGLGVGGSGTAYIGYDNSHFVRTAAGKLTAGTYNVVTITKTAGSTSSAGTSIYVNGAGVCGPAMATACTVGGGAVTPNTQAAPWIFGLYGNGSGDCVTAGGNCNLQLSFTGTYAAFALWNRVLSAPEVKRTCEELARAYGRQPRNISLTCN
jgi:Concanavalin A-like lectin/glucanases superfamily